MGLVERLLLRDLRLSTRCVRLVDVETREEIAGVRVEAALGLAPHQLLHEPGDMALELQVLRALILDDAESNFQLLAKPCDLLCRRIVHAYVIAYV